MDECIRIYSSHHFRFRLKKKIHINNGTLNQAQMANISFVYVVDDETLELAVSAMKNINTDVIVDIIEDDLGRRIHVSI